MQKIRIFAAALAVSAIAATPVSAQSLNSPIVVASTYAMAHAAQTGTTNYGVVTQTVDLTGDGYDEIFALYSLVGEFGLPQGEYLAYFVGGPGGYRQVSRIDMPGRNTEITGYQENSVTLQSNTANGLVTLSFSASPDGLTPLQASGGK
jgi:hypothetical protein